MVLDISGKHQYYNGYILLLVEKKVQNYTYLYEILRRKYSYYVGTLNSNNNYFNNTIRAFRNIEHSMLNTCIKIVFIYVSHFELFYELIFIIPTTYIISDISLQYSQYVNNYFR